MNLLATPRGRRTLFAALYFSEGAPVGFVWWALPAILRAEGVEVGTITQLTSLLVLPWGIKFIWAPVVDVLRTARWGFRSWIVTMQIGMGLALLPLAFGSIKASMGLATTLLVIHAFLAATQDAAVDALCISSVPEGERGWINGWMQVGYISGRALFGGVALVAMAWIGEAGVIIALVAAVWSSSLLLMFGAEAKGPGAVDRPSQRLARYVPLMKSALASRVTWLGLAFALVGGCGFEAVGSVAGPLLIDSGLDQRWVGIFFIVFALPGALAGGRLADRLGRRCAVTWLVVAMASVIGLISAALMLKIGGLGALVALMGTLYVLIGAFTASSYAMFMDITRKELGATQFSAYMGATNLCEAWSARSVGTLHGRFGYGPAFGIMAAISLVSVPILMAIGSRRKRQADHPDGEGPL
ncbi:MAG: MFS transporter [Planctomycetia bacterium]|nr:MFS transporter [Planctomycetia bacterium]MCC7313186.1 MFS transporter [Planctomycetota bacterium]